MLLLNVVRANVHVYLQMELLHGLEGVLALLEVNEGVVFGLLCAGDGAILGEGGLDLLLGGVQVEIAHVEHLHLGHGLLVGLLGLFGPVDDELAVEEPVEARRLQLALGHRGRLVVDELDEAEAAILQLVVLHLQVAHRDLGHTLCERAECYINRSLTKNEMSG